MRRLLSVVLIFVLALSCMPFSAFAADDTQLKLILDEGIDNLINFDIYPWAEAGSFVLFITPEVPDGCTVRYYRNGKVMPEEAIKRNFFEGSDALELLEGPNQFVASAVDVSGTVVPGSQSKPISIYGENFDFVPSSFSEGILKLDDADMISKARNSSGHEKELTRALIDYDEATGVGTRTGIAQSRRQNTGWNSYAKRMTFKRSSGSMETEYFVDGEIEANKLQLMVFLAKYPSDTVVGDPFIVHINKDRSIDVQGKPTRFVGGPFEWNHIKVTINHTTRSADVYINKVLVAKYIPFHADITNLSYFCIHGLGIDKNIYYDGYVGGSSTNKVGRVLVQEALDNAENMYGKAVEASFDEGATTVKVNKEALLNGFRTDLIIGAITKEGQFFRTDVDCNIHSTTPLIEEFRFDVADVDRIVLWRKADMSLITQLGNPKYYK